MTLKTFGLSCAAVCGLVVLLPAQKNQPAAAPVQTPSDPNAPLFRVDTRLVQVDAIVRDKNGPLKGLTKDDFVVMDNNQPQPISVFSVRKVEGDSKAVPLPAGVFGNRPQYKGTEPVAATVILLDYMNTPVEASAFARLQALKYLSSSNRTEEIAVYTLNEKLKVLQEFSDDRDLVFRAVERSKPETSMQLGTGSLTQGLSGNGVSELTRMARQRQEDNTVAAFYAVSRHLAGLPGRKKLIWITTALPLASTDTQSHNGVSTSEYHDLSKTTQNAIQALNDANIGVYPVDPRGAGLDLSDANLGTMGLIASITGGAVAGGSNDMAGMLEQVMQDTDLTYTLGYYRSGTELDGKYHNITVKVNRPGVDIRSRQGYEADPPRVVTEKKNRRTLNAWMQEPLEATDIALNGRATPVAGKPGFFRVEVAVNVSDLQLENKNNRWVGSFAIAIAPDVENNPKGLLQTIKVNLAQERLSLALATGFNVVNTVNATNQGGRLLAKALHVVVMDDATGKTGSVRLPIEYTPPPRMLTQGKQGPGRGMQPSSQIPSASSSGRSGGGGGMGGGQIGGGGGGGGRGR